MSSCVDPYNAELPVSETDVLVIEGTIVSGEQCNFYLSKTMPLNVADISGAMVSNATIRLVGSDGTNVSGSMSEPGTYVINVPQLKASTSYNIEVSYNGDTYVSEQQTPLPSTPVKVVEGSQPGGYDTNINILVTTEVPANPNEIQYYRYTYDETWEIRPEYKCYGYWDTENNCGVRVENMYPERGWVMNRGKDIIASSSAYYSNNQIVQYKLYDIPCNDSRTSHTYSTIIHQRSMRKAEYEYEKERIRVSTEMGGLFTPQPSALPTNIQCTTSAKRVLGYIGCSLGMAHYRLFINRDDFQTYHTNHCTIITSDDEEFTSNKDMAADPTKALLLYTADALGIYTSWTLHNCVDITPRITTTQKPEYWP